MVERSSATDAMFADFCAANHNGAATYDVVVFGDSKAMADELGHLVLTGVKKATAGLLRSFGEDEPMPVVDGYVVVVDGSAVALCVYQTIEFRIGPLNSVDEAFAWDEGEGDRTRNWWLAAHGEFFKREAAREGFEFHDNIETVFERFKVVWPMR